MRMRWIAMLVFVGFGLAPSAGAATYNYYLQVPALSPLAAWSMNWQSDTLALPTCGSGGNISTYTINGGPFGGFFPPTSVQLCSLTPGFPTLTVIFGTGGDTANYTADFSSTDPPSALGVFSTSETAMLFGPTFGGGQYVPGIIPGPRATLTITKAIWFAPIPRWFGTIIRIFLTAGPITPPPGAPVEAVVGFVDLSGNPIEQLPAVQIVAGHVTTFELNTTLPLSAIGQHFEVVPVVSALQGQSLPPIQLTAEVVDRLSGYATVFTSMAGLAPPLALAPQGLAGGQTMRLTATAYPPNPCNATLSFANAQGVAIGPSLTVNLSPGQSQPLDLNSAALNLGAGASAVVQPMVTLQAPVNSAVVVGAPACMVASDVFDQITGRTFTYQTANVQ